MNPSPRPISTRAVLLPDMAERRTLFVYCPRLERAVPLESGCAACTACAGFTTSQDPSRRPASLCSYADPAGDASRRPVGAILSRHAICVRADAVGAVRGLGLQGSCTPIVDDDACLIGTLDSRGRVHAAGDAGRTAVPEQASVSRALRQMAALHCRSAPVVARDGIVVGVVEDIDALRAVTAREAL